LILQNRRRFLNYISMRSPSNPVIRNQLASEDPPPNGSIIVSLPLSQRTIQM
jgi:hypothetical protein